MKIAAWVTANQTGTLTTMVVATAPGRVSANLNPTAANAALTPRELLKIIYAGTARFTIKVKTCTLKNLNKITTKHFTRKTLKFWLVKALIKLI